MQLNHVIYENLDKLVGNQTLAIILIENL